MSENRKRLLELLRILRRQSDTEHRLNAGQIASLLQEKGVLSGSRNTIYEDLKTLNEYGYETDCRNGYWLSEAPFSLSEVKILTDAVNGLEDLDERSAEQLAEKLYSFLSVYEEKDLKEISYAKRHRNARLINRLEDCLYAIRNQRMLRVTAKRKESELYPLFLHRQNERYYLYYHYPGSEKIYHMRLDGIKKIELTEEKDPLNIPLQKVRELIESSTDSFMKGKAKVYSFTILNDSETLRQRLTEDFPTVVFTKKGFSVRAGLSHVFLSKLFAYGTDIKTDDPEIVSMYTEYLDRLRELYQRP